MNTAQDTKEIIPSEEKFVFLQDDVRIKLISVSFAKILRVIPFCDGFPLSTITDKYPSGQVLQDLYQRCEAFAEMVQSVVLLPHHEFWSTILYNSPFIESIFDYLKIANVSPGMEPLFIRSHSFFPLIFEIKNLVFQFFYRFFTTREDSTRFLSQEYHDNILLKYFGDFPRFCRILQHFQRVPEYFSLSISLFMERQQPWFAKNFETLRTILIERIEHLANSSLDHLIPFFEVIVSDFWIVSKLTFYVKQESLKDCIFIQEDFILCMIKFYGNFLNFLKPFIDVNPSNQLTHMLEPLIQKFQVCLINLFDKHFKFIIMDNLFLSFKKSNAELYKSLEQFDLKMKNLFTYHEQFMVDYFEYVDFDSTFILFRGEELKRIVKPETSLLNYREALESARARFEPSNNWWSPSSFLTSPLPPSKDAAEVVDGEHSKKDASSNGSEFEYLKCSPEIASKMKLIKEITADDSLGDGFLYLCLEYYSFDQDKTVDAIFEDILPSDLKNLKRDLTRDEANKIKREQADKLKAFSRAYIGKKDKVNSVLKQDKNILKEKTLGLFNKISEEEEAKVEEAKRLIERGGDIEEMKKNIQYIGMDIYNDEYDDTYENEDFVFEKSNENEDEKKNSSQNSNNLNQNFNHSISNRNQWKSEQNDNDEMDLEENVPTDQKNNYSPRFFSHEKFSNASQHRKNQYQNKKRFNKKNHSGDNITQNSSQDSDCKNYNSNQSNTADKTNGDFRSLNIGNHKRPNHENGNNAKPNKRK